MYNPEFQVYFDNIQENFLTNLHAAIESEEKLSSVYFYITFLPM